MCAEFVDITTLFARGRLRTPVLDVLTPDAQLYDILAVQPVGNISVTPTFIGHVDRAAAIAKYNSFLGLAAATLAALVLCPEYSCPWAVLDTALRGGVVPTAGKLWILGCESITPRELAEFISRHPGVEWINEPIPHRGGQFLDVLAYLTVAESLGGQMKTVVALQFKTSAMGGHVFERDHLIPGTAIYYWHNPRQNIRLLTLICSEAMNFSPSAEEPLRFDLYPYLVIHPQMNLAPRHAAICGYRSQLFNRNLGDRAEVITLNWARGFAIPGGPASAYGASAIYTKSGAQFDCSDARIVLNHQKGLYFGQWTDYRTALCLLNFDEHVFRFRLPKTVQDVPGVVARRTGPEMTSLYSWDAAASAWQETNQADDGFATLCASLDNPGCDYGLDTQVVDRERLLTVSAGRLKPTINWHAVEQLESFAVERDERSKRLTFTHETDQASADFRDLHLSRYTTLRMHILPNPDTFPATIADLRNDWRLGAPVGVNRRFNLTCASGQPKQGATVMYIGDAAPAFAKQLRDDIVREWGKIDTRRLVVWHSRGDAFCCEYAPLPTFTDDLEPPASIVSPAPT